MASTFATPTRCYWELTRRCHGACIFCRTRTTPDLPERGIEEAMRIASQLIEAGMHKVVLTGGEPILYAGWEKIAANLSAANIQVWLSANGIGFTSKTAAVARASGISRVLISIDGDEEVHNRLRPAASHSNNSFTSAMHAIDHCIHNGLEVTAVTEVNRLNAGSLPAIYAILKHQKITSWQIHLCGLTGAAASCPEPLACSHKDLEAISQLVVRVNQEQTIRAPLHCTVGYMTKEEALLRSPGTSGKLFFDGCPAGIRTFCITPSGRVKGCITLPDEFAVAHLRDRPLKDILRDDSCFPYTRQGRMGRVLEAHCATCSFGEICQGGCPSIAFGLTGSIGANPLCLHHLRVTGATST